MGRPPWGGVGRWLCPICGQGKKLPGSKWCVGCYESINRYRDRTSPQIYELLRDTIRAAKRLEAALDAD